MNIVVLGPKGGEAKIALHDGRGLQKDFLNKSFVKKSLANHIKKSGLSKTTASETILKEEEKPKGP